MAERIAVFSWERTALGPIELWPGHVRAVVGMALRSHVPIVTLWGERGVMIYNEAYSIFAGARDASLLGAPVREGWPEVADFNDHVVKTVLSGGTLSYRDHELILHRQGRPEQLWLNLDYSPVVDDSGVPCGVIAILSETTAKVRAEQRVRGERERLRSMFEQAPGFMAMLHGPQHIFDLANRAYMQLVGHRDVVGKPVREALPEIEGQGNFEMLDQVYASGEAYIGRSIKASLQRTPGDAPQERFIDVVYQPLRDDHDQVVGIFVEGSDVTERVLAEQQVKNSEAQFRAFAQAMPNHVWAATPSGELYWFNETVYAYSGTRPGDLDGHKWGSLVHPDDLPGSIERWVAALEAATTYESEFRLRRADGRYRWHIARAVPIRGSAGEVTGWIGTNTDIEEQRSVASGNAAAPR